MCGLMLLDIVHCSFELLVIIKLNKMSMHCMNELFLQLIIIVLIRLASSMILVDQDLLFSQLQLQLSEFFSETADHIVKVQKALPHLILNLQLNLMNLCFQRAL
jgi:hypothetical protein